MRTSRNLKLIAAITLTLLVLSDESQARRRQCVAPEITNYCEHIICTGYSARSLCVTRCIWNVTAGDCWSSPNSVTFRFWE